MNRRVLLLLVVLVALVAIVVLVVLPALNGGSVGGGPVAQQGTVAPTATPIVTAPIVVAVQQLPRGIRIPASALVVQQWPVESIPDRHISDISKVADQLARTDIYIGEPILDTLIVPDLSQIARTGSDAAVVTPKGRVLVSIPVDKLTDVGYAVQDGDYVDVIVSFLFVNVDPRFQSITPDKLTIQTIKSDGTVSLAPGQEGEIVPPSIPLPTGSFLIEGPSENQRPRLATQRTVQGAWVIHVGTFPLFGSYLRPPPATPTPIPQTAEGQPTPTGVPPTPTPPFPDIVTLAVTPQDAVVLTWVIEANIPITLALRSSQGDPTALEDPTNAVSLEYMLSTFNVTQPPELPYALEPALRSIRNLQAGGQIIFSGSTGSGTGTGSGQ